MQKKYDYMVYVGRFQPAHHAHLTIIKRALELAKQVIILIGSANQARTIKDPWTWQERSKMILSSLPQNLHDRIMIEPLRDIKYNDQQWVQQIQDIVTKYVANKTIGIIGYAKDETSYYLQMFPQWELFEVDKINNIHATDIRNRYFQANNASINFDINGDLPPAIYDYLRAFMLCDEYEMLVDEYKFIEKYKTAWTNSPYPPTFVTVDTIVIQSGHVLLVRRKANPGKNLWAISGGFVDRNERLETAAIRELKKETKIKIPISVLKGNIKYNFVADDPNRSLRGRTISHVYGIELPPGPLPKISKLGGDDARNAEWIPLAVFNHMEDQMFEDHYHLVQKFCNFLGT